MCHVQTIDVIFIIIYVCLHVENHRRFPGARPGGSLAKVCAKRGELFTSSRFPEGSGPLEKKLPAPRAQPEKPTLRATGARPGGSLSKMCAKRGEFYLCV